MARKLRLIRFMLPWLMLPIIAAQCSIIANLPVEVTPTSQASPTFTDLVLTNTPILPTNTVVPPTHTPRPPTATGTPLPPTETNTPPQSTSAENLVVTFHLIKPSQGNLAELLAAEVQKAEDLGMTPVVYFDASW